MNRIIAIFKKEVKQLVRDKKMLFVVFFFPAFLLGVFGYAVNFDVKNVQLVVLDNSNTNLSRDFINKLSKSTYFNLVKHISKQEEISEILDSKEAQLILVIPSDFKKDIKRSDKSAEVQCIIDGVDGNTAAIIKNYITAFTYEFSSGISANVQKKLGRNFNFPIEMKPIFMFNPTLETTIFLIPGLIAMILIVTTVVTVSLSLVREKERGTIEQINVSSIRTIELIIGKVAPYIIIAIINSYLVLLSSYALFGVVVKGSHFLLFLSILIFIISSSSIGIFISILADSQQVAFTASITITMLPSVILSGFIFPIESMPALLQPVSNITPATFFIIALRSIILKGVGLGAFGVQLLYLLVFPVVLVFLSIIVTKKKQLSA